MCKLTKNIIKILLVNEKMKLQWSGSCSLLAQFSTNFPTKLCFPIWLACYRTHQKQSRGETTEPEDRAVWQLYEDGNKPDFVATSSITQTDAGSILQVVTEQSWWFLMRHSGSECCLIIHSEKMLCGLIPSGQQK